MTCVSRVRREQSEACAPVRVGVCLSRCCLCGCVAAHCERMAVSAWLSSGKQCHGWAHGKERALGSGAWAQIDRCVLSRPCAALTGARCGKRGVWPCLPGVECGQRQGAYLMQLQALRPSSGALCLCMANCYWGGCQQALAHAAVSCDCASVTLHAITPPCPPG